MGPDERFAQRVRPHDKTIAITTNSSSTPKPKTKVACNHFPSQNGVLTCERVVAQRTPHSKLLIIIRSLSNFICGYGPLA